MPKHNARTMSADEIRALLTGEYGWDIASMAGDCCLTVPQLVVLLLKGGKGCTEEPPKTKVTYDVAFEPMTNVETEVADPQNPTEEEQNAIIQKAAMKILSSFDEMISAENLSLIRLYSIEGKETRQTVIFTTSTTEK